MFFNLFRRKRVNNITVKKDCDKVAKHIRRVTTKKLKKGMLPDSHSLAEHLNYVDNSYASIKQDIQNTTMVVDYQKVRGERYSNTEQMLDFYQVKYVKLKNMYQHVAKVADDVNRKSELSGEKLAAIDTDKLRKKFEALDRDEKDWDKPIRQVSQHNRRDTAPKTIAGSAPQNITIFSDVQRKDNPFARREERK